MKIKMSATLLLFAAVVGCATTAVSCSKKADQGSDGAAPPASAAAAAAASDPVAVVKAYLSSSKCEDRVQYVLNPDGDRAVMADWYKDKADCAAKYESIDDKGCATVDADGACSMKIVWGERKTAFGTRTSSTWFCLKKTSAGFKIDWRCSAGYNPMTVKSLKAQYAGRKKGQTLSGTFRVYAKMGSYYNYNYLYADKTQYSIDLQDDDGDSLHGYVKKDSPDGVAYFDLLKDGESHAIMADASYGPGAQSNDQVNLGHFNKGWRERPEEFGAPAGDGGTPPNTPPTASVGSGDTSAAASALAVVVASLPAPAPDMAACCASLEQAALSASDTQRNAYTTLLMSCRMNSPAPAVGRKTQLRQNATALNLPPLPAACQ
jgi:hypothetical protein